jgi:CDP-6-deoxy-D-xylo-4-hexulose-3-dehydrase|tara:strand:+ start:995 stop:2152 length:1158 start_codon:yes stop_codon:yes gene_type:complete
MIRLADNIIEKQDVDVLTKWLSETDHYTKGQKTIDFENQWSAWQGCKYSIFVNSGSSANLLVVAGLLYSNRLKNNKIIVPAVSWVTTVSPAIMLGLEPVLCDADEANLGLSVEDFEALCIEHNPAAVMIVHVLGHSNHMAEIIEICNKYDVILIEDTCEAHGSTYNKIKLGNFGIASTFSYFYGHQMATVEGGMVCTDDYELYNVMLSIRSHGWLRDNDEDFAQKCLDKYKMHDDFNKQYFFVYPGLNIRNTDINAVIGLNQIKRIDDYIASRNSSYNAYCAYLDGKVWTQKSDNDIVSSLAFGVIDKNKKIITDKLTNNGIECRPLICGSIQEQPFWYERYPTRHLPVAKRVHEFGFYIPCHQNLKPEQVEFISKIILENSVGI